MNRHLLLLTGILVLILAGFRSAAQPWVTGSGTNIYYAPGTAGNVGINTSSPWSALDVRTNGSTGTGYYGMNLQNPSTAAYSTINLSLSTGGYGSMIQSQLNASTKGTRLFFHTSDLNGNVTPRMTITESGNVGIGNTSPGYRLDLATSQTLEGMRLVHNNLGYLLIHPNSLSAGAYNQITQSGDAGIVFGDYNQSSPSTSYGFVIVPWLGTGSGMRIDKSGNVGIGMADTRGYQLAVNGSAVFAKVVVKSNPGADYVFDSAYRLRPLAELRQYVRDNHHLPDITPADSMLNHGLDLGVNQTALLRKIEELTLYIIDQDKRLGEADRRLDEQRDLLKTQQEMIERMQKLVYKKPHPFPCAEGGRGL